MSQEGVKKLKNFRTVSLLTAIVAMLLVVTSPPTWGQSAADVEKFSDDKLREERAYTLGV